MSSLFSVGSAALPPFFSQNGHRLRRSHPPISISTNPSHVDILRLRDLFASSGHSCHRLPVPSGDGLVEPTDPGKLRLAIYHSFIVISVFCRSNFLPSAGGGSNTIPEETSAAVGFQDFFERNFRSPGPDHHLIGFGRAVSDRGLTASIHDVVILPSLQKRGIGRKIVERIIRILTNKGIYDISALCSEKERMFFEACGFGKDPFDSTTMLYTRSTSIGQNSNFVHRTAGHLQPGVPPAPEL